MSKVGIAADLLSSRSCLRFWSLEFGIYLVFGAWNLEFALLLVLLVISCFRSFVFSCFIFDQTGSLSVRRRCLAETSLQ